MLNKVTRDLNVGIATVVEFLQKKGYTVEANPNTKITEEQYAMLVKEFSTDKNLRLESERFIQERQNKDRNKASVSIDGYDKKEPEKTVADDVIKTVIPEDVRPKFKPVVKISLDKLNRRTEKEPVKEEPKPQPVVATEEKKVAEEVKPVVNEVKKEEVATAPVASESKPVKEEPKPVVVEKPAETEKKVVEEVKKEEPKVVVSPEKTEKKEEKPVAEAPATPVEKEEEGVFKIRPTEFVSKINVIGQIDLAALNQSTRPKKKSKEEKRKEREEKEKLRQDQKKQMKEAIIKEIRKEDNKQAKVAGKENLDPNGKKKLNRIN